MKKLTKAIIFSLVAAFFLFLPTGLNAQTKKEIKQAQELVRDADLLYRRRDYNAAIEKYAEALSIVPNYPYAHLSKGFSHLRLDQYDLALNELTMALDQGHNKIEVYSVRWRVYFMKGDLENAMSDVKAAQAIAPDDPVFHIAEGRILNKRKEYTKALESFDRAVNLGTKDGNANYYRAVSFHGMGDYKQQYDAAELALSSGTQHPGECWYFKGNYLKHERKYKEAGQAYRTSLGTNPDLNHSYRELAETYRLLNDFKNAVKIAQQGLEKFPDDTELLVNLIRYYSLDDKNHFSISLGEKMISEQSQNAQLYINLCRAYSYHGQYYYDRKAVAQARGFFNNAIQKCMRALELEPDNGESLYYLGRTYQILNDQKLSAANYQKSIRGLEKFTESNPDDADGFYLLGNSYFTTQQYQKAIDAYKKCLQITPRFAKVIFSLGYAYHLLKNKAAAVEQYEKLKTIDFKSAENLRQVIESE